MNVKHYLVGAALVGLSSLPLSAATLPAVGEFEGVAGIGSSNGVVTDSPLGSNYAYVTTAGSSYMGAGLGIGNERNGSELTTFSFAAAVGSKLDLFFNYVTSDGAGFSDYAYVFLTNLAEDIQTVLFTARTIVDGDTVPGFGLPVINPSVTLTPASTPIIAGGPAWNELDGDSGQCFQGAANGCGYTDWINAAYEFDTAGTYTLTFGVVNWTDTDFDSGLAVAGIKIDDVIIVDPNLPPVPVPASGLLLIGGLALLGGLRRKMAR